jgi:DNA-binding NarL/FixJ family response regulator
MNKYKLLLAIKNQKLLECIEFYLKNNIDYISSSRYLLTNKIFDFKKAFEADIILIDVDMPFHLGMNTAKKILKLFPQKKLIALTFYPQKNYMEELKSAGFKGCILKDDVFVNLELSLLMTINGNYCFSDISNY